MLRKLICGLFALVIFTGIVLADEAKGKFKKLEKGTVTLTVEGKETEYKLDKETKIFDGATEIEGKDGRKFLRELKEGSEVTLVYAKDGDQITVKEVKVKK